MSGIKTELNENGFILSVEEELTLPLGSAVNQLATSDQEASAFHALDDLWQDGYIDSINDDRWLVPFDRLVHVDQPTCNALNLPTPDRRVQAKLRSVGIATSGDFELKVEFFHPDFGRLDLNRLNGPLFTVTGGASVLLSPEMWKLILSVQDRPDKLEPHEARFEYLSRCVGAAVDASASVDDYLRDNALEVIQSVALEAEEVGDELHLGTKCNGLSSADLLLPNGKAKPFPTRISKSGERQRVVVSSETRDVIESVATKRVLEGAEVPQFLQNPEAFLPEGLDLAEFSERVRGFNTQVYNSRPYLHVNKEPRGWLDFDLGVNLESSIGGEGRDEIPIDHYRDLVTEAEKTGARFVKYGDNWVEVDAEQAKQFLKTVDRIEELRTRDERPTSRVLLDVIPNVDLLEFEIVLPEDIQQSRPWFEELPQIEPPKSFAAQLDSYQLTGFRWLSYLHDQSAGGLLADEMGVGKTAQVIALFTKLFEEDRLSPALVVLPKTLISNWMTELINFAPEIDRLHVHTGSGRSQSGAFLASMNVVITTYDTARMDQIMLGAIDWTVVVADEAQFVKNPTAARTSVVKALKAKQALALTGTPVENGLIEFWCIMDYVQPGLLKSWADFRTEFERPLVEASDFAGREKLVDQLLGNLDPHYLRRLKEEVLLDLPEKKIAPAIEVSLGALQRDRYQGIVAEAKAGGRGAVLGAITRLLMTCAHPRASEGDWDAVETDALVDECPKLKKTLEIIESIELANEKVLIFTNWKAVQKILQKSIWAKFGVTAEIVNGDLTSRRQEVIDQFRQHSGFGVLILAPEVAGFGLNLIEANHVIHYTRPWNPAKENQATDRVHRRGQSRPVTIYYPTVVGTVEDKLAELLAEKSQLTRDVLRPTNERTVTVDDLVDGLELSDLEQ